MEAPPAPSCETPSARWLIPVCLLLCAVVLKTMSRLTWCACGEWNPWTGDVLGSHLSQHLFDPYSFTHILHGFMFGGLLSLVFSKRPLMFRFMLVVAVECGWEILENSPFIIQRYRTLTSSFGYVGDSIANSFGDIFCCSFGFWLSQKLGLRRSIVFFLATELILLLWIRDSLVLNIIMLFFPLESIKAWQLAR